MDGISFYNTNDNDIPKKKRRNQCIINTTHYSGTTSYFDFEASQRSNELCSFGSDNDVKECVTIAMESLRGDEIMDDVELNTDDKKAVTSPATAIKNHRFKDKSCWDSIIISGLFWIVVILCVFMDYQVLVGVLGLLYVANFFECILCDTVMVLNKYWKDMTFSEYVEVLKGNEPKVVWSLINYDDRVVKKEKVNNAHFRNKKQKTGRAKIVTVEKKEIEYNQCVDKTQIDGDDGNNLIFLELFKKVNLDRNHKMEKNLFISQNTKSVQHEFIQQIYIEGFKSQVLIRADERDGQSCLNFIIFWILSIFMLSPIFRFAFSKKCNVRKEVIVKDILS